MPQKAAAVVGCRVELEGGGWVKKGSGWQPQSFQYGANSICICLSHPSPITRPAQPLPLPLALLWPGLAGCPIMKCSSNACGINFCHNCQVLGKRQEGVAGGTWLSNVYCKLANKRNGNATKRVSLFVNCVRPPTKLTPKPVGQAAA